MQFLLFFIHRKILSLVSLWFCFSEFILENEIMKSILLLQINSFFFFFFWMNEQPSSGRSQFRSFNICISDTTIFHELLILGISQAFSYLLLKWEWVFLWKLCGKYAFLKMWPNILWNACFYLILSMFNFLNIVLCEIQIVFTMIISNYLPLWKMTYLEF